MTISVCGTIPVGRRHQFIKRAGEWASAETMVNHARRSDFHRLPDIISEEHGLGIIILREVDGGAVETDPRIGDRVHLHHVTVGGTT